MAITIKKGNFTLGFTIPTRDQLEKERLAGANDRRVQVYDNTIQNMFSKNASSTPTQDYMSAVTPVNKKFGQYGEVLEKKYQQDIDNINNVTNMHKKLNTVPYSNITDELNRLQVQLQNGEISGSAFAIKVASLYKKMYDSKAGVLTDDNVLRLSALDTSLKGNIKNYNTLYGTTKKSTLDPTTGVLTSQLNPQADNQRTFLRTVQSSGKVDFSNIAIPSVNEEQTKVFGKTTRKLDFYAKDGDINLSNTLTPIMEELIFANILGDIQVTNPDLVEGYTDGLNSMGIQGDNIKEGIQTRVRVLVREGLKKAGIEVIPEQEDAIVTEVIDEIAKQTEAAKDSGNYTNEELVNYADSGLKAEMEFNQLAKNIDTQFMTNVKSFSEVNDLLTLMKDQLNIEELIENSDKFDDNEKQLLLKNLDNILVGAFVNKGAAGSSEEVLLGKGLIVMTKFLEDLGIETINPSELAKSLKITEENKDLWVRAMKRINTAKRDSVAILEEHPELKTRYNNYYDPFDVSQKYSGININLTSALTGETINLAENETITDKENKDLLSVLEEFSRQKQGTATVAQAATPTEDNELGYTVSDNEIGEYKTAAIETIVKYNMLDDMELLNRFIANYTLEIDENMSVELQDKFKDMVLNTINTDSAAV
jgi:hypothetical protein|tara:strand:+ start:1930 stop:3882 length:1953 start_codon:yes stop_codon:yes gene_type:complete